VSRRCRRAFFLRLTLQRVSPACGKHGCGRSHQSYFSLSKIRVSDSLCTEMLTYQSPSGTTASVSMK
jgi:hypothetical protein